MAVRRDVNMAKQSYHVFFIYLSAIILIYSDNIDYCRVVKIGRFFSSVSSTGQSEAD